MASSKDFKVIIAGGGVAGLTLANMLEKFHIDYILLESHGEIAPPVGASIGLFPNGLRILDQIDCFETIMALAHENLRVTYQRDYTGKVVNSIRDTRNHMAKRHGYRILFFDRQWLLQVLYDQVKHKDRILLKKKVAKINLGADGVQVITTDGDEFTGSIVIGADGVHSAVRNEMFRLGHELQPGYFERDEVDKVPAYYKCSFGIAQHVPGWVQGEQHILTGKGTSQLVISGPENRVYWFLFVRLPTPKFGKDIPKYTKEDEAELVKEHHDLPITENVTFGQVYDKRLTSTLTPLHEVVYKKWFFKRIMIIGDAAHKPNPIGGQGGNAAIETCAELVNALVEKLDSRPPGVASLSEDDIAAAFSQAQAARYARAQQVVDLAHKTQSFNAFEKPWISALVSSVSKFAGDEAVLNLIGGIMLGSARIKRLPMPARPRTIPFRDELLVQPISERVSKIVRGGFLAGMAGMVWLAGKAAPLAAAGAGDWGVSGPLLTQSALSTLPLINLALQRVSPLLIYTIEGHRTGNQGTLLALPSVFAVGMQLLGLGRVAPVHAAISAWQGYKVPPGRFVRPELAQASILALALAYAVPSTAALVQSNGAVLPWKSYVTLWNLSPLLLSAMTWAVSRGIRRWQQARPAAKETKQEDVETLPETFDRYTTTDAPILKRAYKYAFAVQAAMHIATLVYLRSTGLSLTQALFGLPSGPGGSSGFSALGPQVATFAQLQQVFAIAAIVASNLYSVWELRSLGYVKTREALKAAAGVVLGQALVGSSATWAALWYWKEQVLCRLGR